MSTALARMRQEFLGAILVMIGAAAVVGIFWLLSTGAPSSGRDPDWSMPAFAPTRSSPPATPAPPAIT